MTDLDPATLLRNTLTTLGMKQIGLALRTGLSPKHINQIALGKQAISSDVALRFERATGIPALEWMHAEAAYRDGLLRTRPRVWWSDNNGVLEQLPGRNSPPKLLRVVNGQILDELPADAIELLPAGTTDR